MEIEPPLDADEYRYWAEKRWESWNADRSVVLDYISDQSRWMIASLLVINAGALAAVVQANGPSHDVGRAAWSFVSGITFTIGCGLVTWGHAQWVALRMMNPLADPLWIIRPGYLPKVSGREYQLTKAAPAFALALGFAALASFIVGAVQVSSGQARSARANDRRCLAIQADMLSARPRRLDDAALFQALSCRPQGDGGVHAMPLSAAGK